MVRVIKNIRGMFLIEALIVIIPFILTTVILLESFRREIFQVVMAHIVCVEARARALGAQNRDVDQKTRKFLEIALGKALGTQIWKMSKSEVSKILNPAELSWLKVGKNPGALSQRWLRYEQLLSFNFGKRSKHHQEIIKRCLYPLS